MDYIVGFVSISLVALLYFLLFKPKHTNLPPSPPAWPIVGHLPDLISKNSPPFLDYMSNIAQKYGPLIHLKFGLHSSIFASTKEAAMEVLQTNDKVLSGRQPLPCFRIKPHIDYSILWSDSNSYWKKGRKILHTEIFSQKMLQAQEKNRERVAGNLVNFIMTKVGDVVELRSWLFGCALNVLGHVVFSKDVFEYSDQSDEVGMDKLIHGMLMTGGDFDVASYFPVLARFDLHGLKRKMDEQFKLLIKIWEGEVLARRANRNPEPKDMLDVLIANDFNEHQINAMFMETFGPGSDTNSNIIEWALAQLIKNPDKLAKLREELDRVVGRSSTVKESHFSELPYLQACVKETMRLYPPISIMIPHRCMETCQVMGYTIPKGMDVHVNAHAIGRDPKDWKDPLKFQPERFLDSDIEYNGKQFQFIPFGSGRRICPGRPLAVRIIPLVLASLVHAFGWELPDGVPNEKLDMEELFTLSLCMAKPLRVIPKVRI
uniref:Berbamunine synthase n=1 Tax=Berberis stolonifera TaxID=33814 RepID=C80A1_BERST|nr:RecName: Full=Berbamunine synthase; AltName: Full=(S)-N-methylcoclaurine oxidase [C-O phenol-coupling]; AltName: Full=CYPLXXX; AltName: Full=Cytochrome P450 80 [Berberis stolonifera]AAC48987.1 cytochrome P-450 CYP80 [Berberis stolonifera]